VLEVEALARHRAPRSPRITPRPVRLALALVLPSVACADPVLQAPEGVTRAFPILRSVTNEVLAQGGPDLANRPSLTARDVDVPSRPVGRYPACKSATRNLPRSAQHFGGVISAARMLPLEGEGQHQTIEGRTT
jgi:hypothetical protein